MSQSAESGNLSGNMKEQRERQRERERQRQREREREKERERGRERPCGLKIWKLEIILSGKREGQERPGMSED